ncbi:MAG: elongation factor P [Candidatus Omnitrophica bacterium]|nr:elongation factor P [Candidatus Omnitrophota bacterium]
MEWIEANALKRKMLITVEGQPFSIVDVMYASPSARGASTMARVKLRNLLNGAVLEKNFKTSERFTVPDVEETPASFLYSEDTTYHFMDDTSYEQFSLSFEKLGDLKGYIKEGVEIKAVKYNGAYISLSLPVYVELQVITTEPVIKGATASGNVTKVAELETGISVRVPMYIEQGDKVKVNTQTGEVAGRA